MREISKQKFKNPFKRSFLDKAANYSSMKKSSLLALGTVDLGNVRVESGKTTTIKLDFKKGPSRHEF